MSTSTHTDTARAQHTRSAADLIAAYPEGTFTREADAVTDELADRIGSLRERDILVRVGSVERTDTNDDTYDLGQFEVAADARALAHQVIDHRDAICPCGHAGLRNCGDHFECLAPICERTFQRDQLAVDG